MLIGATNYSQAAKSAVIQQVICLLIASQILDTGVISLFFLAVALAFWVGFSIIWIRHRTDPTSMDLLLIEIGYPVLCVIGFLLCRLIWLWAE